jgi:hypothetical protein
MAGLRILLGVGLFVKGNEVGVDNKNNNLSIHRITFLNCTTKENESDFPSSLLKYNACLKSDVMQTFP